MKTNKLMLAAAFAALTLASCEKPDGSHQEICPVAKLSILTFEDQDWKGGNYTLNYCGKEVKTWSDLIVAEQYEDPMLYKFDADENYHWYDADNTFLKGASMAVRYESEQWGTSEYWSYGHAVSNFTTDTEEGVDNLKQLSVIVKDPEMKAGGHDGSKNFCIHFGYKTYPEAPIPALEFGDGKARVIDHMWVNNTAYVLNVAMHGNQFSKACGEQDWLKIVATGFNGTEKTGMTEFFLVNTGKKFVTTWTKWNLTGLGAVSKVEFDIQSSVANDYGMTLPAYFAYDDVAVVME